MIEWRRKWSLGSRPCRNPGFAYVRWGDLWKGALSTTFLQMRPRSISPCADETFEGTIFHPAQSTAVRSEVSTSLHVVRLPPRADSGGLPASAKDVVKKMWDEYAALGGKGST